MTPRYAKAGIQLLASMQFEDGSFDVAFDKGGLDALMGDEGEGADTAGVPLLLLCPSAGMSEVATAWQQQACCAS
jgi:hypothetical protein